MGTHPIFESDFDCLTECLGTTAPQIRKCTSVTWGVTHRVPPRLKKKCPTTESSFQSGSLDDPQDSDTSNSKTHATRKPKTIPIPLSPSWQIPFPLPTPSIPLTIPRTTSIAQLRKISIT